MYKVPMHAGAIRKFFLWFVRMYGKILHKLFSRTNAQPYNNLYLERNCSRLYVVVNILYNAYVCNKYRILFIKFTIKALRTLVESRCLPSDSTCVLEAEPG